MAKPKPAPGISSRLIDLLERVRPEDPAKPGRPMSDNKWCEEAGVSSGFWRDLRKKGTVPSIDNVERMARVTGLKLSELIEGAEAPAQPLPNEDEIAEMVASAQGELEPGTTLADYPRFVGPALLSRLQRYVSDRRSNPGSGSSNAPDKGAPPPGSTKPDAQA